MLVVGTCQILSSILVLAMVEKGYNTRINALFLIISWGVFILIVRNFTKSKVTTESSNVNPTTDNRYFYHFRRATLDFAGVAISAYLMIQSVNALSKNFHISEYIESLFPVAIGTSLPELFVNISAVKKKESSLTIGNTLRSCIFDACFSIGIGPLFFLISVSGNLAAMTGVYVLIGSVLVILMLAYIGKVDRKLGSFS